MTAAPLGDVVGSAPARAESGAGAIAIGNTLRKFTLTLASVMALVAGIFLVLFLWLYSGVGLPSGIKGDVDFSFVIPTALYLSFIAGWAIAYCRTFRFPERQRVLLLGVVIGGLVIPLLAASYGLYLGKAAVTDLLMFLAARLIGAALQLYFFVLCLRYLFKVTP